MAIPLVAWGVGLALLMMGSKSSAPKKPDANPAPDTVPPPKPAILSLGKNWVLRIQNGLIALGIKDCFGEAISATNAMDYATTCAIGNYVAPRGLTRPTGSSPSDFAALVALIESEVARLKTKKH